MIEALIKKLHPLERKVLPLLKNNKQLHSLVKESNLKQVEVIRALQWLENKKIIITKKTTTKIINLDKNGILYLKESLPERKFLEAIKEPLTLKEIQKKTKLDKNELNVSLGILKKRFAIKINRTISITKKGIELLNKGFPEERLLRSLPIELNLLDDEQKFAYSNLKQRKNIIKTLEKKSITIALTELGHKILEKKLDYNLVENLTVNMLKTGSWKNKEFRHYDIKINVPKIFPGKRHFIKEVIEHIRKIWLELGFKEMSGSLIQSSFWNFDALFVPQDHPAREMQDTIFLKSKSYLPSFYKKIKKIHENSWKYKWNEEIAKTNVLRTHTTCLSAQTIAKLKKSDLPAKFFSIGKVFRNETLDWSHLFEFYQVEGIVLDENVNFTHLKAYLKEFYRKMGYEKIRIRPAYFPYTEPSCEIEVFVPEKNSWIELGGAGMFRPEMMEGLGLKSVNCLAWGLGLERIISLYYGIKDIRKIYKNDLKQLKQTKLWLK